MQHSGNKTSSPSVFVVLLNWNGIDDTLECLASLRGLTHPNVTAVVVDNASRDDQAARIAAAFPDAVVLPQSENLGFCGGCNAGIKYALGAGADFVMLLNNDTLVEPDSVTRLLEGFGALAGAGAVSPLILEHPATDRVWFSRARWDAGGAKFRLAAPDDEPASLRRAEPYESEFACGCCLLASSSVFAAHGLLDERYFAYYDEAEWCARLRANGLASYVVPSAVIFHKVSRSTPGLVSTYLLTRNRLLWMRENLPFATRLKSAAYLFRELFWHWRNARRDDPSALYSPRHSRAVLRGWRDYVRGRFGKWDADTENIIFPKNDA